MNKDLMKSTTHWRIKRGVYWGATVIGHVFPVIGEFN